MTGLDSAFLALETPSTPMHVLGVALLDTRDMDPHRFHDRFRQRLSDRIDIDALPMLRRKLAPGPFIADGAAWVVDDEVDLDWHLRCAALRSPGNREALFEFVGRMAARPLDRTRPLWEMWLVEGLEGGRMAIVAKMHHAIVDGVGGATLLATLCDVGPDDEPEHQHESDDFESDDYESDACESDHEDDHEREGESRATRSGDSDAAPPSTALRSVADGGGAGGSSVWQVPVRALASGVLLPIRLTRQVLRTLGVVVRLGVDRFARPADERGALPFSGADTKINQAVTSDRSVAFAEIPMDDIESIRQCVDVSVNDVVLAGCTGALRRYLEREERIPDAPLVAAVPVSIDAPASANGANAVSALLVHLPVHEPDPVAQLRQIRNAMRVAKQDHERMDPSLIGEWAEVAPGFLLDVLSSLYAKLDLADRHAPPYNLVVSNVRGPEQPLSCVGARVEACFPLGPIYENAGLNLTVLSYDGRLLLGAIGCPRTTPGLHHLTDAFVEQIGELQRALGRGPTKPASPRREPIPERLVSSARDHRDIVVIVR